MQQDSVGNIYLTRQGRDPEVPGIAIGFPVDGGCSSTIFTSAFRTFSSLAGEDLLCDVILLGWTTLQGKVLGQDIWRSSVSLNEWQSAVGQVATPAATISGMDQFQALPSPSQFPVSAVFEIAKNGDEAVMASGSPVLVEKARKHSGEDLIVGPSKEKFLRAPELRIEGVRAEEVAHATISDYMHYIAALFDNFD